MITDARSEKLLAKVFQTEEGMIDH
jgi:hypothetical protein